MIHAINITTKAEIDGFTIGDSPTNDYGIYLENCSGQMVIRNNIIKNVKNKTGRGIYTTNSFGIIENNEIYDIGGGIYTNQNSSFIIRNNKAIGRVAA